MTPRLDATIHPGRNNVLKLALHTVARPLLPAEYAAITRVQLLIGATLLDSSVTPTAFDWSDNAGVTIKFDTLAKADGIYRAWLVVYDITKTAGVVMATGKIEVVNV